MRVERSVGLRDRGLMSESLLGDGCETSHGGKEREEERGGEEGDGKDKESGERC